MLTSIAPHRIWFSLCFKHKKINFLLPEPLSQSSRPRRGVKMNVDLHRSKLGKSSVQPEPPPSGWGWVARGVSCLQARTQTSYREDKLLRSEETMQLKTRMHSNRMRTVRCSGRRGSLPGGFLPQCMLGYTPPPRTEWQTLVKTLHFLNYVANGKKMKTQNGAVLHNCALEVGHFILLSALHLIENYFNTRRSKVRQNIC